MLGSIRPNAAVGIGGHAATGGKPLIERRSCDKLATSSRWIDCGIAPLIVDHMEDETNRLYVVSPVPPTEGAGLVNVRSSPVKEVIIRFWSVPIQLGQVLPSTFSMMTLSTMEYVPK